MKEIKYGAFKLLNARDIVKGQCLKLMSDGEMVGYVVVNPEGAMVPRIEGICSQIDASKGFK